MINVEFTSEELIRLQKLELDALKEIDRICKKYNIIYSLTGGTLIGAIRHKGFIPWDDDIDIAIPRSEFERLESICAKELDSRFFWQCHETDSSWYRLYAKIRVNDTEFKELAHSKYNIHHGVFIDIFPLDNVPDNVFLKKIQFIKFKFYNIGLSVKYINPEYRDNKSKIIASFLKIFYFPFSLAFLYRKADKCLKKYNKINCSKINNFNGAYGKKEIFPKFYFYETIDLPFENTTFKGTKYYDQILKQIYGEYMKCPPVEKRKSLHKVVSYHF